VGYVKLKAVIGLEIHIQVNRAKSKMFCGCPANYRDAPPNTNICPVCLGLPGSLPVPNKEVIRKAVMLSLALGSRLNNHVVFVRKHYFYPDLPKGYQISQHRGPGMAPIAVGGSLEIEGDLGAKIVRIRRIGVEEDPARITYPYGDPVKSPYSLIDYNRSGVPLLEVVTEPDLSSGKEARSFVEKLLTLVDHLGICDPDLEGAFRVDVNISINGGERVEIKNIGSIRDIEKAINYEVIRQSALLMGGGVVKRETRHWDPIKGVTIVSRHKEFEEEYRYFPDPDLPATPLSKEMIEEIRISMPELPWHRAERYVKSYGLSQYTAKVLVSRKVLSEFFEETIKIYSDASKVADLLINDFLGIVNSRGRSFNIVKARPQHIAKLLTMLDRGIISIKIAKMILERVVINGEDPEEIVMREGLIVISDEAELEALAERVIRENPKAVEDAKKNPKAINYLVGQVMKLTRGKADPQKISYIIRKKLGISANSSLQ
jgi:aspartyl-tRNA(Asn)/glutamyl-tRNA(Gln) amidotransferase subunit B